MTKNFCSTLLGLTVIVILLAGEVLAETFEFLTYTPPRGWTAQVSPERTVYQRSSGVGLINFYASNSATGTASDEFSKMWRSRIEPTLPGIAPQPQIQHEGDYSIAVGARQVNADGTTTTLGMVAIVGKGRALGVLTMAAGDEVLREVTAFLDSLDINANAPATTTAPGSNEIGVDFDVPSGYTSKRDGQMIVLSPTTLNEKTPCVYGLSPSRSSSANLETDARAALLEPLPGWQIKNDSYSAVRGVSGQGWNYFWFHTDVQSLANGSYQYLSAMAMAFSAGAGKVSIVWGFGPPARCAWDDITFAQFFHSLRLRGSTSDSQALAKELKGLWRNSQSVGMAQYKFLENGRYEFGIGTVTQFGIFERTSSSVSDGSYKLSGGELTISPDRRDRSTSKYSVRIYDEYFRGGWTRAMSLFNENTKLDVQYYRIEESR